jgi:WD40 repeat protein
LSQDGKYLAISHGLNAANTYKVTLWSLPDGEFITEVASSGEYDFTSICFTSNSNVLAYTNTGGFALYDIESRQRGTGTWAPNVYWMRADRGNRLVTAGTDIQVWEIFDSRNFEKIWKLPGYSIFYNSLSSGGKADISPDGKKLAVAGIDTEEVLIYDIDNNAVIQTLDGAPPKVYWISWSADLRYLAVIGANSQGVYIWDLETGERVLSSFYNSELDSCYSFCFHPGGEYFATGSFGGYVSIERINNRETIYFEPLHHGQVWALAFTPDGKQLISGGWDRFVSILDLQDIIPAE